ncbi:MAG: helix-turn-helix transcriptional regulator [Chloroflexi bacterium]|nr:helix-turn-helix transcriptional regulator [Chloroflexota bacterium]
MNRSLRHDRSSLYEHWLMLARESGYSVRGLAIKHHVTVRHLDRYFQEHFGRPPKELLNEQRMIDARALLLEADSIKQVAAQLGFKQPSHFCREFKRCYEMTPSQFIALFLKWLPA